MNGETRIMGVTTRQELPPLLERSPSALDDLIERVRGAGVPLFLLLLVGVALVVAVTQNIGGLSPTALARGLREVVPTLLLLVVGMLAAQFALYLLLARVIKTRFALPYTLLLPSAIGLLIFFVYPFFYDIAIAFSNMSLRTLLNPEYGVQYGIDNFSRVFSGRLLQTKDSTFSVIFVRTVVWTTVNVFFHVLGGLGLALLLNRDIRFKGLYRTLLIVPWAIPQVIVAMVWRNEFHSQYGFVNQLLQAVGLNPLPWLSDPFWAFVAVIIVNVWLGIPFMMVIILGGLQSISQEYYEAAEMDGASWWQGFQNITVPLLRPVLAPAITLGTIWTFNNINVIFLITEGGPQEKTNILVTALYNAAFGFSRYSYAAAFSLVIFLILFAFSLLWVRATGALNSVYE